MRTLIALILLFASTASAQVGLRRVVLDPGHGGTNTGARDPRTGVYEKVHTLVVARQIALHLREAGVPEVILTREEDREIPLLERINHANRVGADLFVSVHFNSTEKPGPSGHETFFLSLEASDETARRLADFENIEGRTVAAAASQLPGSDAVGAILLDLTQTQAHQDAQRLAATIQRRLTPKSPFKNRGVKQAPFYVLMGAAMPAVVVEVGFLNHPEEGPFIASQDGQRRLARGIADGILDFGRQVVALRRRRAPEPVAPEGAH